MSADDLTSIINDSKADEPNSPKDVCNWLWQQGITPYPCNPRSKAPIYALSTDAVYGGQRKDDSFLIPTKERQLAIEDFWSNHDLTALTPNDVSISIQNAAGYNDGRSFVWIDIDDSQLVEPFENSHALKKCIIVKGQKGCKLGAFVDANGSKLDSPQWFDESSIKNNKPAIEIINNKHGLIWGQHPSSPSVYYKIVRGFGEDIPTLQWGDVLYEVSRIASEKGLKIRNEFDYTKSKSKNDSQRKKLESDEEISLRDVYTDGKGKRTGDGVLCAHPVHGSSTGINLHLNYNEDMWYCFRCNSGGGPLEFKAVLMGLIDCSEAGPDCLPKSHYKKVFNALRDEGIIQIRDTDTVRNVVVTDNKTKITTITNKKQQDAPDLPDIPIEPIKYGLCTTIDELKEKFKAHFNIEEDYNITGPICAFLGNFHPSECDIIGVVGSSGSLKTELMRVFGETENQFCYPVSSITEHTFVSGLKENIDLAPSLRNRVVVIKDLTTLLSKREDIRAEVFADFRELTDGYVRKEFGNGVKKEYRGIHSSILFACTNAIERYYSMYSNLGSRMMFMRPYNDKVKARKQSIKNRNKLTDIRRELHEAMMCFIHTLVDRLDREPETLYELDTETEILDEIGECCDFLALARTTIHHNYKGDIDELPESEFPTRIFNTVTKLAMVHAFIHERVPNEKDKAFAFRIICDNVPTIRLQVMKHVLTDWKTTPEIGQASGLSTESTKRVLDELTALGLCEKWSKYDKTAGVDAKANADSYKFVPYWYDVFHTILDGCESLNVEGCDSLRYDINNNIEKKEEKEDETEEIYTHHPNHTLQVYDSDNGGDKRATEKDTETVKSLLKDCTRQYLSAALEKPDSEQYKVWLPRFVSNTGETTMDFINVGRVLADLVKEDSEFKEDFYNAIAKSVGGA